jgi:hypothetical protein
METGPEYEKFKEMKNMGGNHCSCGCSSGAGANAAGIKSQTHE